MPEPTNTPIEGEAKPQAPAPETKPQTPEAKPPVDVSAIDLEELKKLNPSVAKALLDAEEIKTKLNKYEKDQEASDRKKKEEEGKWQELANDNDAKRQEAETRLGEVQKKLDKFSGTIETILKEVEKTIPDDKKALIPEEFSSRQKLEYIVKNAALLGATPLNRGAAVPKNEENYPLDEEGKVQQEYDELLKKQKEGTATRTESNKLLELSSKLKEIRTRKTEK